MQTDMTRELLIRSISRELKELHSIAKTFPQNKYDNHNDYGRDKMVSISTIIRDRRKELNELTRLDPLLSRQLEYDAMNSNNSRMRDFEYYEDPSSGKIAYRNSDGKMLSSYRRFNSLVFSIAPGWEQGKTDKTVFFNPVIHWKDDFLEHIRNNDANYHDKVHHFRIDNEFYGWDEYFKYDNKAWKRLEWALNDGKLVDLSKSIRVDTDLSDWHWPGITFAHTEYMQVPSDEKFVNAFEERKKNQEKGFLGIYIDSSNFQTNLVGRYFIYSLFVKDKTRYTVPDNESQLVLSKEQLEGCELRSSDEHKRTLNSILHHFAEAYHNEFPRYGIETILNKAKSKFLSELRFKVFFVDPDTAQSKGIKEQIWRELFNDQRQYSAFELQSLLPVATQLLQEEKKYATK
jgi:hypothetical protein